MKAGRVENEGPGGSQRPPGSGRKSSKIPAEVERTYVPGGVPTEGPGLQSEKKTLLDAARTGKSLFSEIELAPTWEHRF